MATTHRMIQMPITYKDQALLLKARRFKRPQEAPVAMSTRE